MTLTDLVERYGSVRPSEAWDAEHLVEDFLSSDTEAFHVLASLARPVVSSLEDHPCLENVLNDFFYEYLMSLRSIIGQESMAHIIRTLDLAPISIKNQRSVRETLTVAEECVKAGRGGVADSRLQASIRRYKASTA